MMHGCASLAASNLATKPSAHMLQKTAFMLVACHDMLHTTLIPLYVWNGGVTSIGHSWAVHLWS